VLETSLTWLGRLTTAPSGQDWRRLVDVYTPLFSNWLTRLGVPDSDREDLVQEVLVVVMKRVQDFEHRGPGAFRAWIRSILVNQARKFFRDRPLHPSIDPDQLAQDDSILARRWDAEHDHFIANRAMKIVEGDFAPATWQAFRRQVFDSQPAAEVAAELGLSLNAVLLAKSRILKRLREELRGLVE
jgi:RNA polymerase sigma-70 factor, ECF subfamily